MTGVIDVLMVSSTWASCSAIYHQNVNDACHYDQCSASYEQVSGFLLVVSGPTMTCGHPHTAFTAAAGVSHGRFHRHRAYPGTRRPARGGALHRGAGG